MANSKAQQQTQARLMAIRRLIHDQPALAVQIIRQWLASDGRATTANTRGDATRAIEPRPARPASTKLRS